MDRAPFLACTPTLPATDINDLRRDERCDKSHFSPCPPGPTIVDATGAGRETIGIETGINVLANIEGVRLVQEAIMTKGIEGQADHVVPGEAGRDTDEAMVSLCLC